MQHYQKTLPAIIIQIASNVNRIPHGNIILTKFVNIYTKRWSANGILCQQAQGYVRGHMLF